MVAQTITLLHHSKENPDKKAPMTSAERWNKWKQSTGKGYRQSPEYKWLKMKQDLRRRIKNKKIRIAQLEKELAQYE